MVSRGFQRCSGTQASTQRQQFSRFSTAEAVSVCKPRQCSGPYLATSPRIPRKRPHKGRLPSCPASPSHLPCPYLQRTTSQPWRWSSTRGKTGSDFNRELFQIKPAVLEVLLNATSSHTSLPGSRKAAVLHPAAAGSRCCVGTESWGWR